MVTTKDHLDKLIRIGGHSGRYDYTRLDMNENPTGLPGEFVESIKNKITPSFLATYPEVTRIKKKLADYLGVKEKNIAIANGSDSEIKYIFEAFVNPGDKVLMVNPTFEMYPVYTEMYQGEPLLVEYDSEMQVSFDEFYEKAHFADIIVILNPNNPIGTIFSHEQIERVIKVAQENDALVVIDEAYHYFYAGTCLDLAIKYDNVLLLRTFSKLCSLAACRVGFAVGNEKLIEYVSKVQPTYDVNAFAILFVEDLLDNIEVIDGLIAEEKIGREYLSEKLAAEKIPHNQSESNYIFINCEDKVAELEKELERQGILIKTYSKPLLKNFIRVTTGRKEVMDKFCKVFIPLYHCLLN